MNNAYTAAFPRPWSWDTSPNGVTMDREEPHDAQTGLTKRELFAAMAMQGFLSMLSTGREVTLKNGFTAAEGIAVSAVECADALLAELAKP
jgi:hypothetical protein